MATCSISRSVWGRCLSALVIALSLSVAPACALADCQMFKVAELPVTMSGMQALVPAKINGADATFIVDSGAFYSIISPAGAAQYQLKLHRAPDFLTLEGIGGSVAHVSATTVEKLTLLNQTIPRIEFIVAGSEMGHDAIGVLGQNVLGFVDTEYDLAKGVIRLMKPGDGCRKAVLAYWVTSGPYSVIDLDWNRRSQGLSFAVARVNGTKIHIVFDTGAGTSFLTRRAAERAGFKPDGAGVVPGGVSHGFGSRNYQTWIAPFDSFTIGDETINHTRLRVGDADVPGGDMLLGMDFFLSHHVYVAKSQDKVYFTYNGGPVFNLAQLPSKQAAPPPADASAPGEDKAPEPTDAAGYARRGAAYASRRDFEHAIADLTRAGELDPNEASYFRQRGVALWSNKQAQLAMADFDQALKLKPDDIDALLWRARLRLGHHDIAGASADLAALDRLVPLEANVRLEIANTYLRADMSEQALPQFDSWIAAHPDDAQVASAKNGRCWARALLGADLSKALKDCDDALRMMKSAQFLDGRALVLLRLGQYDKSIADYDAALSLNPRNAWSLYGRGVDRLRKGMAADGQTDIDAAIAISPSIAEEARKHGIAP